MRLGLWKKDLFTIQAKNYARLSIGKKWDGDRRVREGWRLGQQWRRSLIECFWITDMYIKYFGPMPNGIFSCALSYQFYR